MNGVALWALVALPVGAGVILALAGLSRQPSVERAAGPLALSVSAVVVALAVLVATSRPSVSAPLIPGSEATLEVDGLSAVMVLLVAVVTPLVLMFATADLRPDDARARFFGLMLIFAGTMLLTVTATSLLVLLAAWEVMGATSYMLIGYWWRDPDRVHAANTAFLTTRAADLGLYLATGAALAGAGSLALSDTAGAVQPWRDALTAGVVLAALGKSAQLPFSFWLGRAMAGPSTVSALLHSATMVAAGGYLLLRIRPLLESTGWAGPTVAWIGALTALALGAVAAGQRDLKQLLAASTAAQIGFVVLAAGVGATAGGSMQLVAHAAVKSALFLAAGAWLTALGTKQLAGLGGAAGRFRWLGAAAVIGLVTLAGVPPLSLWVTKDSVMTVVAAESLPLYVVALAAAAVSAAYAGRALSTVLGRPTGPVGEQLEEHPTGRVPTLAAGPVVVLAGVGAVLGLQALPPVREAYAEALGTSAIPPGLAELTASGLLALAVLVLVVRRRGQIFGSGPVGAWCAGWLALEPAADRLAVRPVLALAHALAVIDDRVIDRGVEASAVLTRRFAATGMARAETVVDSLPSSLARMTAALGRLARRPQTGQLHQYYAQAAAGLALLSLVILLVR